MNHHIQAEEEHTMSMCVETEAALRDQLAQCGWSTEEIVAFLKYSWEKRPPSGFFHRYLVN